MARSVAISGGSTSNFSGEESVAAGKGRKIRLIENKNCSFPRLRNDASFSASSGAVFFELASLTSHPLFAQSFQFWAIANRVNQRKQRDAEPDRFNFEPLLDVPARFPPLSNAT
jgi:hypothetical protein